VSFDKGSRIRRRARSFVQLAIAMLRPRSIERRMLVLAQPTYWRAASATQRWRLRLSGQLFSVGYGARAGVANVGAFTGLLRLILRSVAISVAAVAATEIASIIYHHYLTASGLHPTKGPLGALSVGTPLQPSDYENLLFAIATVGGTLLALYFTTVGVVAATAYADVPSTVRALFVTERASRVYARVLAALVVACVVVLMMRSTGYQPHRLTIYLIVAGAVFAVFSLVALGERLFNFFDPIELSRRLPADLDRWVRFAGADAHRSDNPAFQNLYQRQAEEVLATLQQLVELATSGQHQTEPESLLQLVRRVDAMWTRYARRRCRIPRDSAWFERVPEHADWLQGDYIKISTAVQTSTDVQADLVPDRMWVERRLLRMLQMLSSALFAQPDPRPAYEIAARLRNKTAELARTGSFGESLRTLNTLTEIVDAMIDSSAAATDAAPPAPTEEPDPTVVTVLAVVDEHALSVISVLLATTEWAGTALDQQRFPEWIQQALGAHRHTHGGRVADRAAEALEWLAASISFERSAEGRRITPDWYVNHIVAMTMLTSLAEALETIMEGYSGDPLITSDQVVTCADTSDSQKWSWL